MTTEQAWAQAESGPTGPLWVNKGLGNTLSILGGQQMAARKYLLDTFGIDGKSGSDSCLTAPEYVFRQLQTLTYSLYFALAGCCSSYRQHGMVRGLSNWVAFWRYRGSIVKLALQTSRVTRWYKEVKNLHMNIFTAQLIICKVSSYSGILSHWIIM